MQNEQQRKPWDEYFMDMANLAATRSTCLRRHVGCILVRDRRVLATGYNGVPSKSIHCEEIGCVRKELGIPSGTRMDMCRAVHAEANAIFQCARFGVSCEDSTAYITVSPCAKCAAMLVQAGIARVVCGDRYPDATALSILAEAHIPVVSL